MEKGTGIELASDRDYKLNNKGLSLIELIAVISIMSILTGMAAISANLAFSKDAHQCATRLNDAIYSVRMDSMSKPGAYYMEVKQSGGEYIAVINDGTSDIDELRLSENGKISNISYELNGTSVNISDSNIAKIVFDKSKGNVKSFNDVPFATSGEAGTQTDGLIVFTISQKNGDRSDTVTLVTSTGKHKVGN